MPLITIDPEDARDHDDAVFAEVDPDPKNPGGWIVWVAIADVAAYVRVGSALDREAWTKANSVYFPDRVEPMLPERLSAGLCSLREGEPRATLAVRMVFGADGRKRGHKFVRGLMRSAAKLSYGQAQKAIDGLAGRRDRPVAGERAEAALGRLRLRRQGPRRPLAAGYRQPRTPHRAERRGRGHLHRQARAAGRPPPDRGVHDPGQRLRRRNPGAEKEPADLPRARHAERDEAVFAGGFPRHHRHQLDQGRAPEDRTVQQAPHRNPRGPARRDRQRGGAADPDAGALQPRQHRPFRPESGPLRPLHLADPPLCRPDRPPRPDPRVEAWATTA